VFLARVWNDVLNNYLSSVACHHQHYHQPACHGSWRSRCCRKHICITEGPVYFFFFFFTPFSLQLPCVSSPSVWLFWEMLHTDIARLSLAQSPKEEVFKDVIGPVPLSMNKITRADLLLWWAVLSEKQTNKQTKKQQNKKQKGHQCTSSKLEKSMRCFSPKSIEISIC